MLCSSSRAQLVLFVSALAVSAPAQALKKTLVVSGLDRPVWVGSPPGERDRLFVVEQRLGRVRIFEQSLLPQPFLDLGSSMVAQGGEQGLLSVAFHPDYANNGRFFVYYARASDNATVVARYQVSANPYVADPGSAVVLLTVQQSFAWHNGGAMQFGPDGFLYVALGDGGTTNGCISQRGDTLLGKILRLDVDHGSPYAVPATNPFVGQAGILPEIWNLGFRNPWRFCFDRLTGDMYIGDVGNSSREEISFQPGGSSGGLNFGWGTMEGTLCQATCTGPQCGDPQLRMPIHEYVTSQAPGGAGCAVIGGVVYRGCAMPQLQGRYFFGDYCTANVWSLRTDGLQAYDLRDHSADLDPPGETSMSTLASFGEDGRGEIYVTNLIGGRVYRIEPEVPLPVTDLGGGKVGGNGKIPTYELCGPMTFGTLTESSLRHAPPSMPCALLISVQNNAITLPFGTLLVDPVVEAQFMVTNPAGEVSFLVRGVAGPATVFGQWVMLDPGAVGGIGISNALQIDFPTVTWDHRH